MARLGNCATENVAIGSEFLNEQHRAQNTQPPFSGNGVTGARHGGTRTPVGTNWNLSNKKALPARENIDTDGLRTFPGASRYSFPSLLVILNIFSQIK